MQIKPDLVSLFGLNIQGDFGGMTAYKSARNRFTWFASTTPKVAASIIQQQQRQRWTQAAALWSAMTPNDRNKWAAATAAAHLCISAYNLWMHCVTTWDLDLLATISRKTGITLNLRTSNAPSD